MHRAAVVDVVKLLYEVGRSERAKHTRDAGTYWVLDLVRCLLKKDYEMRYPELSSREVFTPAFVHGSLVHRGLQSLLREVYSDRVLVEVESAKGLQAPGVGERIVIRGRADAILITDDGRVGIEIKTSRTDANIPHDHHLDQVMIYNWLFELKYSVLLYITPDRITQYTVFERATEDDIIDRITNAKYPRYQWECGYCAYAVLCPYKRVTSR